MLKLDLTIGEMLKMLETEAVGVAPKVLKRKVNLCMDSRESAKGVVFWPIKGVRFDAHKFVNQMEKEGALMSVVNQKAVEEYSTQNETFKAYADFFKLRKSHPAFHMTTADDIFNNVTLDENSTDSVVIFDINGAAVGDSWSNIKVVLNSTKSAVEVSGVEGMTKVVDNNHIDDGEVAQNTQAAGQSVSIWVTE